LPWSIAKKFLLNIIVPKTFDIRLWARPQWECQLSIPT
jgi:hypothetical protein